MSHTHWLPIGLVVGGLVGLILLEPDLGTAMTLLVIAVSMVFAAGLSYRYVVGAILCGLPVMYFILMGAAYRRRRLMAFWDPWSDPLGDGFQVIQSLIAVGSGGLIGRGFMAGVQKLFYLPEPHTDFIYAVIGEEFGLLGTTLVLACFMVIAWRGFKIAMQAPDRFGAFLAVGLTTMIAAQALLQHQRRAGPRADQGDSAAVRQQRRIVLADQPARHGDSAECLSARGAGIVTSGEHAGRDCGRRNGRPSVSGARGGPRAEGAGARRADFVRRHSGGHRGACDSGNRVLARFDPERRIEGESLWRLALRGAVLVPLAASTRGG